MKLLALTEGPNHVCYRYRIESFRGALAERGWDLEAVPLVPGTFQRSPQLRLAADANVVILQRRLLPLWQVQLLRGVAPVLIYDIDDAVFHRDSYSRKKPASWTRLAHFWATIYAADAVTAGNRYLQEQAACYVAPERVELIPTCVNPDLYPQARHTRVGADVQLTWIGQHSTLPCLILAEHVLSAATSAVPGLTLRVVCNRFPRLRGIRVSQHVWSESTESEELAAADIGISWLPDDPWSLGKCGLKVLQYMAAGLPVVANPVGMNCEMVRDGVTGFIARTPVEWAAAVRRLANDPELRARMGAAGRKRVEDHYSVQHWGPRFADLIDRMGQRGPRSDLHQPRISASLDMPRRETSLVER